MEHVPNLLLRDEKLKDPSNVANASNNLFITITQKIKHSTNRDRRCYVTSKRFISWKFPQHRNNPNYWSWDKNNNTFPKPKTKCQVMVTSTILKACASLISHPLSYIYNHLLYTGIFPGCPKIAEVKTTLHKRGQNQYDKLQAYFISNCVFLRYSRKLRRVGNICMLTD